MYSNSIPNIPMNKMTTKKPTEIIDRIIGIVGIAFDVKDLFEELGILPDKQSEEFEKVLTAIGDNYAAIQAVGKKVDRNFAAMEIVYQVISKTLSVIENTRIEMRQEFNKVLNSLEDLKVGDKISSLATFIDDFTRQVTEVNELSPEVRVTELNRPGGILDRLTIAVDSDGILHGNLNQIINQKLAIPKDENDSVAFAALHIMYYGLQTYVSVMFFILDQYSFLSDYYYKKGDIEKCNGYFDLLQINFKYFKGKLLYFEKKKQLIYTVITILNDVKDLLFVRNERGDIYKLLQQRVKSLTLVFQKIEEMVLPIYLDQPNKLLKVPEFINSNVETPIEDWINGAKVSYAVQCKKNNTYSKIGEWSDPVMVSTKASPVLKIPVDSQRRTRLIYRKFNNDKPQLIEIIEDTYQTDIEDINRDVYNAALNINETIGINEIKILLKNGATLVKSYEHGRRVIHAAAQSGNTQIANYLLLKNNTVDINVKDDNGFSAMYIASEAGYDHFVEFLLKKGADVNIKTNLKKLTPLHIAAWNGYASTIQILLKDNKIDINARANLDYTPLHSAVYGGINVVNILISNNETDVNAKSSSYLTPLHLAAIDNYDDVIKNLVENKRVDLNVVSKGNMTALHFASSLGNFKSVEVLVRSNKTNINAQSSNNLTALHFAISLKKYNVAQLLLNLTQIDVNLKAKGNITPLHIASLLGRKDIMLKLIEKTDLIEERTKENLTALHIAVIHNQHNVVSILIDNGADLESKVNGSTPLHLASFYGSKESAVVLLKKGANVKKFDKNGLNPIHIAASRGKIDVIRELIHFNKNLINIKSLDIANRSSALHFAAQNGYLDIIKYLVNEENADYYIKNKLDDNPLHHACKYGRLDIVKYFIDEKNFPISIKNCYEESPLHLAALSGNLDMLKYFIDVKNADINVVTNDYDSILHYAALSGNLNIVKYLIDEKSVTIDSYNRVNYTPYSYAVWYNHQEVYQYLLQKGASIGNNLVPAVLSGNLELVKKMSTSNTHYPLALAARYGYIDILKYFIDEKKADIKMTFTLLHFAGLSGNINLLKYFLEEKHISVNSYFTIVGISPLCCASLSGSLESVKYLVSKGARTSPFYDITAAPASFAVASGNLETIKYFVEDLKENVTLGYSLSPYKLLTLKDFGTYNSISKYIETDLNKYIFPFTYHYRNKLLDTSVARANLNVIKYFIDEKKISSDINNALFTAIEYNNFDVIKYLVEEKSVNINIKDEGGNTPLYETIKYSNNMLDIVKYLVDSGADINNRNNYGETFLHIVSKCNALDIAKYLIEDKKFDKNIGDNTNTTPLHLSIKYKSYLISQYLIRNGAKVTVKTTYGVTPLHVAVGSAFDGDTPEILNTVISLVEKGADVNAEDDKRETPLDYLGFIADSKIKYYLISKGAHYGPKITNNFNNQQAYTWIKNLTQNTMNYLADFSGCIKFVRNANSDQRLKNVQIQNFDVNGTILLLDVFVRKISCQKYIPTADFDMSLQEAKTYALNIVTEFESMLKRTAKIYKISHEKWNIDFFELYLNINKEAVQSRLSTIPNLLYESIEKSSLNKIEFENILKCNIKELLSRENFYNKQYIDNNTVQLTDNVNFMNSLLSVNKSSLNLFKNKSIT